jgi:molybdenum cofactor biosynthesis enzyme MoaA
MYNSEQIQAQQEELRQAVLNARPFKPLYVKMKVFYGCNLKCEMCNHWRETRESPVPSERFREVLSELAELGTKKIHISGGEPMLRLGLISFLSRHQSHDDDNRYIDR